MKSHSRKVFLCVVAPLLLPIANVNIVAQQKVFPSITYRLSMTRPVSHLFEVAIEVELPSDFNGESLLFKCRSGLPDVTPSSTLPRTCRRCELFQESVHRRPQCKMVPRTVTRVDDQTWSVPTACTFVA
jgi:hypothetical protein